MNKNGFSPARFGKKRIFIWITLCWLNILLCTELFKDTWNLKFCEIFFMGTVTIEKGSRHVYENKLRVCSVHYGSPDSVRRNYRLKVTHWTTLNYVTKTETTSSSSSGYFFFSFCFSDWRVRLLNSWQVVDYTTHCLF